MSLEEIEKRIAELKAELDKMIAELNAQFNLQVGMKQGAIAELERLREAIKQKPAE